MVESSSSKIKEIFENKEGLRQIRHLLPPDLPEQLLLKVTARSLQSVLKFINASIHAAAETML